jgi:hypothetical protein
VDNSEERFDFHRNFASFVNPLNSFQTNENGADVGRKPQEIRDFASIACPRFIGRSLLAG